MLKTGRPRTQAVLTRLWDMKTFCSKRAFRKTPPSYSFSSVISMFCQNHLRQRVAVVVFLKGEACGAGGSIKPGAW